MRPVRVVVPAPGLDLAPRVEQIAEPAHVEAFLSQAAVETFHMRILDGLARPDVDQIDSSFQAPGQIRPAGELRAIVAADAWGRASLGDGDVNRPEIWAIQKFYPAK